MSISIKNLKVECQESISDDLSKYPFLFKAIRKFSIYLTWLLIQTPISPNVITVSGIISAYFGLVFILLDQYMLSVIFFTYTVLSDFSDGEVSRYKKLISKEGTYLDKVHHLHTTFIFFSAILLYQFFKTENFIFLFCSFSIIPFSILLPFSVTYGVDVAEIVHLRYLITGKRYNSYKLKSQKQLTYESKKQTYKQNSRKITKLLALILNLSRYWGFPYVFVTYGVAFLIEYIFELNGFYINQYLTFFYALTFPILTYIYIWRVLKNKIIENKFKNSVNKK